jgi:hypothetical protein
LVVFPFFFSLKQTTSDEDSVRLYNKIKSYYDKLLQKPSDGIKLVKQGGYAFHVDPAGVYKEMKG